MIPSGYKEDTVFSAIPTDGSGDLSFTRASNGTRVNSAGLVEVCPWNLVQQSETFDNASWAKNTGGTSTVTVTANSGIAPNGTTTADRIQLTRDSLGFAQVIQTVTTTTSQSYTFSVYLKSLSGTPTIMFGSFGGTNTQTATLTNEWVRYTWTATSPSTSAFALLMIWGGVGSTSLSADFLAWGYQLVEGSSAKPYFPTTDRLNVPRLTYQNGGGGCPSLLLEKQSTNLITYSEDFTNAVWLKAGDNVSSPTVTANQITSPDGTQNADKIVFPSVSNSGDFSLVYRNAEALSGSNTTSVYIKGENGGEKVYLFYIVGTTWLNKLCTLTTEWQRFDLTFTGGLISFWHLGVDLRTGSGQSAQSAQTIYAWGAQLEASSYPTSYIPTTSASATRVEDACSKTGISSLIGQTGGTLFVQWINLNNDLCNLIETYNSTSGVTGTSSILIQKSANNEFNIRVFDSLGNYSDNFTATIPLGTNKIALAYEPGSAILYLNGLSIGSNSRTYVFVSTRDTISFDNRGGYARSEVVLFKTRLTNAQLASLTTI
jgi:hypothetical protein